MLHGVPVTQQIADVMGCRLVDVSMISHRAQAFMAGNSMHCVNVGFMILVALLFVTVVSE